MNQIINKPLSQGFSAEAKNNIFSNLKRVSPILGE